MRAFIALVDCSESGLFVIYMPNGVWPEGRIFLPCSASFWMVPS